MITEARVAGRTPEALLREHNVIDADQLSRAIAERYGLDHIDLNVYKVDMGAANLLSMSAARRYRAIPVGYVDHGDRCCWRWPTRRTCLRSTTSR